MTLLSSMHASGSPCRMQMLLAFVFGPFFWLYYALSDWDVRGGNLAVIVAIVLHLGVFFLSAAALDALTSEYYFKRNWWVFGVIPYFIDGVVCAIAQSRDDDEDGD